VTAPWTVEHVDLDVARQHVEVHVGQLPEHWHAARTGWRKPRARC
jgi:hypothetical protein